MNNCNLPILVVIQFHFTSNMYTLTIRYHIDNLITNIFKKCFIGDYMIINLMESLNNFSKKNCRKHLVVSDRNHLLLKKIGYQLEADTMNGTISKMIARIQGTDKINEKKQQQ